MLPPSLPSPSAAAPPPKCIQVWPTSTICVSTLFLTTSAPPVANLLEVRIKRWKKEEEVRPTPTPDVLSICLSLSRRSSPKSLLLAEMETSGAPYLHNQITRYFEEYVENLASVSSLSVVPSPFTSSLTPPPSSLHSSPSRPIDIRVSPQPLTTSPSSNSTPKSRPTTSAEQTTSTDSSPSSIDTG